MRVDGGTGSHAGRLRETALLFLKLGTIGFGGPAAHIAMMEHEVVRLRQWLSREEFLDLLGATNLIPGPNSTEMAIHIGHRHAGWPGLFVAGTCFIVPAACITLLFAWAYVRYAMLPQASAILYGIKPVILVIVAQALWTLGRTALRTPAITAVAIAAMALNALGLNEILVLLFAGILTLSVSLASGNRQLRSLVALGGLAAQTTGVSVLASPFSLGGLFLFFLKTGSVLYGSGYVLLAFLRADLVERLGWLTHAQLLDAVAVGQFTPGPVFTTATFIGYVLGGLPGALVATIGIFAPAFLFVALSGPFVPRMRRSRVAGALLDGVNAGALALMAVVTATLARSALVDAGALGLGLAAAVVLRRYRVNSVWLVLAGGLGGLALRSLAG